MGGRSKLLCLWCLAAIALFFGACTSGSGLAGQERTSTTLEPWATPAQLSAAMVIHAESDATWPLLDDPCVSDHFLAEVGEADYQTQGLKRSSDVSSFLASVRHQHDLKSAFGRAFAECSESINLAEGAFPELNLEFDEVSPVQLTCVGDELRRYPDSLEWAMGLTAEEVAPQTWDRLYKTTNQCLGPERVGEIFNEDLQSAYAVEASTCMALVANSVEDVGLIFQASVLDLDPAPEAITATAKVMRACLDPEPFGAEIAAGISNDPEHHACLGAAILDMMAAGINFDPAFAQAERRVELRTLEAIFTCVPAGPFFEAALGLTLSEETQACLSERLPADSLAFDIVEERRIHIGNGLAFCLDEAELQQLGALSAEEVLF